VKRALPMPSVNDLAKLRVLVVSVGALRIVGYDILEKGEDADLAVKLNSIGGVGCKFDFTGRGPEPRDYVANRPTSLQCATSS
jgi:hypothetical protein